MTPLKRVLLAIVAMLVLMICALFVSWHFQERALGEVLVSDVTATMSRTIERNPKPESAKHENGFACLNDVAAATPADLKPVDLKDQETFATILDAGVVPKAVAPQLAALEPWAASARSCGDSAQLSYVAGLTPFLGIRQTKAERVIITLTRMTRVQVRLLAIEQRWPELAEICAGTLGVSLDYGHVGLIGAMLADATVHQLVRPCIEALQHLSPDARNGFAQRFVNLRSRLVTNSELIELERQSMALTSFRDRLTEEQQQRIPAGEAWRPLSPEEEWSAFVYVRLWGRWDRSMRQLALTANEPGAARQSASQARDELFMHWWGPRTLVTEANYEKFLTRNDDAAALLQLLAEVATHREITLSPTLVKTNEGLEFTKWDGEKLIIPLVH